MSYPGVTVLAKVSELAAAVNATSNATTSAALLARLIEASELVQRLAGRRFDERIETRYYTARSVANDGHVLGMMLMLDDDLRAVTTLTNGDGQVLDNSIYTPLPRGLRTDGITAYSSIRLDAYGGTMWQAGGNDPVASISVLGTWGYGGRWQNGGATLNGNLSDSATSAVYSGSGLEAGMTVKIDSEYLYISAVSGQTLTLTRAVNGSTAAAHNTAAAITYWEALPTVRALVVRLALWRMEQVKAPLAGQAVIGDLVYPVSTDGLPKDVIATLDIARLRRVRMPLAV